VRKAVWCFLLVIFSCTKEEQPIPELTGPGTLAATIDTERKSTKTTTATLEKEPTTNVPNEITITADFVGLTTTSIVLTASTNSINNPLEAGEYIAKGSNPLVSPAYVYYFPNDANGGYISTSVSGPEAGKIIITELDRVNKTISGNFYVVVKRGSGVISINDGVFTQLPYLE
jgi:Family of unknown function (DUF6252)